MELLHETFSQTIKDLMVLQERQKKKCERLEANLKEEQKSTFLSAVQELQVKQDAAVETFHQLDDKINSVAGKVIHLGEQLENVNIPRSRSVEAQMLLNYMAEFIVPGPIVNDLFSADGPRLEQAADVIQKLYTISQDLPSDKFAETKKKISSKYDEIERKLIDAFVWAQKAEDVVTMKKLATILYQFKGYSQCVDAYIEGSQMVRFIGL